MTVSSRRAHDTPAASKYGRHSSSASRERLGSNAETGTKEIFGLSTKYLCEAMYGSIFLHSPKYTYGSLEE